MTDTTPARRVALLRLLEDSENGRMTCDPAWPRDVEYDLLENEWVAGQRAGHGIGWTLTPLGLAAARAQRESESRKHIVAEKGDNR